MAAVSPVGRATGFEPLSPHAGAHTVEALYEQHARSVFAFCLSKLRRREDAEDAVQTTFLHAVRGLQRGVVPEVEVAWLLGIARNVCLSRHASAGRRGRLELVCDPVDLEREPAGIGRGEELIGLREALARLPERQRQAVLLRDWRGLSYDEVAEQLGVSLANAETLIFRGRKALAQLLDEQPATTRSRLAALGNLGSIAAWIKSALTGASLAAKVVAAATTVAAVSATGIAVGTSAPERPAQAHAPRTTPTTPTAATTPRPAAVVPAPAHRDPVPKRQTPARADAPPAAAPAPTLPAAATPTASPASAAQTPTHAAPPPTHARETPVPAKPTVQSTVDKATAPLPVTVPALPEPIGSLPIPPLPPVVEPVVDAVAPVVEPVVAAVAPVTAALPAVTVTPPPIVPLQPVTVDPKKLLP